MVNMLTRVYMVIKIIHCKRIIISRFIKHIAYISITRNMAQQDIELANTCVQNAN